MNRTKEQMKEEWKKQTRNASSKAMSNETNEVQTAS